MTNQERIKEYLVGEKGYLKSDISNGKVIMLSGKWGSGKTHFWQNKIIPTLNKEESKIPNHYISLYGKTTIEEIKSEIFLKVFESVDSFESEEKTKNIVRNSVEIVSSLTKTVSVFGMSLDLSKVTDKSFEKIDNLLKDEKLKRTEEYLNNGAVICIDDFERKSKDIDLNDLFGFITQLTLNFNCRVVIILNDDVFDGEEKKIFSNVKEKSVSKFLYYNPTIEELFRLIFSKHNLSHEWNNLEKDICTYIKETNILNARIYNQLLDSLEEWILISDKEYRKQSILRCIILANIYYILYHTIFYRIKENEYRVKGFNDKLDEHSNNFNSIKNYVRSLESNEKREFKFIENFEIYFNEFEKKILIEKSLERYKEFFDENINYYKSKYFVNYLNIAKDIDNETFNKINNFIETGILIDE